MISRITLLMAQLDLLSRARLIPWYPAVLVIHMVLVHHSSFGASGFRRLLRSCG